jgi:hypothetical protein
LPVPRKPETTVFLGKPLSNDLNDFSNELRYSSLPAKYLGSIPLPGMNGFGILVGANIGKQKNVYFCLPSVVT